MSLFVDPEHLLRETRHETAPKVGLPPPAPPAPAAPRWYAAAKPVLDFLLALALLILTGPLLLFAMLLVKLTSPGPVIYAQTRLGRNGKPFTIYKLRSMTYNCESLTGAQWSTPGDSRVTTIGRWLRKTHLDELPQLWNVLKGDMSLIGPRPERPEFVPQLEAAIPLYRERLLVRPGVTGFAQIQLPADSDMDSVRIKLAYDLYYVRNIGLFFDIKIYFGTFAKVIGLPFHVILGLCGFPTRSAVDGEYQKLSALAEQAERGTAS